MSNSGNVEGRMLIRGDANLGSLTVGSGLLSDPNYVPSPFGVIVGGNLKWTGGTLFPPSERIYIGNFFTGASYLRELIGCENCQDQFYDFNSIEKMNLQILEKAKNSNSGTSYVFEYSGIRVFCSSPVHQYILRIEASHINAATWWDFDIQCDVSFSWVFIITNSLFPPTNFTVNFQGGSPPVLSEKTLWVFDPDSISTIIVGGTDLRGSILGFNHNLVQLGGNIIGKIFVNKISSLVSQLHPQCGSIRDLVISSILSQPIVSGSKSFQCFGGSQFTVGDV